MIKESVLIADNISLFPYTSKTTSPMMWQPGVRA